MGLIIANLIVLDTAPIAPPLSPPSHTQPPPASFPALTTPRPTLSHNTTPSDLIRWRGTSMTVISADHTIYQPPILKSLTGISEDHTIDESALIMSLEIQYGPHLF